MPKDTPSMAKNKIRRALMAILDPYPSTSEVNDLWAYFGSACAYCGRAIVKASRTGHMDHVLSAAQGGTNSVHNHVLACAICNGDEKREESWEVFLAAKVQDPVQASERSARIKSWLARHDGDTLSPELQAEAEAIVAEAVGSFDEAVKKLRALRGSGT